MTSSKRTSVRILDFQVYDVIKCLSIKQEIHLLNNLGSKHSLLIKFGQLMSYYKRKKIYEKNLQNLPPEN